MSDLLRKALAPLGDQAWGEIEGEAARLLQSQMSARKLVDLNGPHGWELSAINLGRLEVPAEQDETEVGYGLRKVQPLVEVRERFVLPQFELDYIDRGAKDADLSALSDAALKCALFEERLVYGGFEPGGVQGIAAVSEHPHLQLTGKAEDYVAAIAKGIQLLQDAAVGGPYALVLGSDPYRSLLQNSRSGYPLRKTIGDLLDGEIAWSPAVTGGLLLSTRGGDFELTIGQDWSVGYWGHDRQGVELYLTESLTFRVLEPAAAVVLEMQ